MFGHEDFGGQLLWALQHYVSINEEGPESAFFSPTPLQGQGAAGAVLPAAAASAGGGNISNNIKHYWTNNKKSFLLRSKN